MAANATLCSSGVRSHNAASKECTEAESMKTPEQGCGNGMGVKGKLREEYRVSGISIVFGP